MAEGSHEEGIVPACALDFAPQGSAIGVGSQDVEGESAQDGEVLRSMVLSRAISIFGKWTSSTYSLSACGDIHTCSRCSSVEVQGGR